MFSLLLIVVILSLVPSSTYMLLRTPEWASKSMFTVGPLLLHSLILIVMVFSESMWKSPVFGLTLLSFLSVAAFQLIRKNSKMETLGIVYIPLSMLLLLLALIAPRQVETLAATPWWVPIHVTLILVGFGCFAVSFGQSLLFLFVRHRLKTKNLKGIAYFPSLASLDQYNYYLTLIGFLALSTGIASGILYSVMNDTFRWDLTTLSTFILWLWYATALHTRLTMGRSGNWAAWFSTIGFSVIAAMLIVAGLYTGSWHMVSQ